MFQKTPAATAVMVEMTIAYSTRSPNGVPHMVYHLAFVFGGPAGTQWKSK